MKNYTRDEYAEARKKLPRPMNDFFDSKEFLTIYRGIFAKHKLNFNQSGIVSDIANATLMGLEPEAVLETNLHQMLPELSNAATHELVADMNDRLFKEARRRVQENIVTPEPVWDEEELGKKPSETDPPLLTDEELDKLVEKEKIEGWKDPEESAEDQEKRLAALTQTTPVIEASTQTTSIVTEKLGISSAPPKDVSAIRSIQKVTPLTPVVSTSVKVPTPGTAEQKPPQVPSSTRIDPYREPIE